MYDLEMFLWPVQFTTTCGMRKDFIKSIMF